ncbi:MAG: hypothetical protein EBZ48_17805 [Proteobacteria bacterium]|nr:hypothetical protein [Pseudomonadota bacterium]
MNLKSMLTQLAVLIVTFVSSGFSGQEAIANPSGRDEALQVCAKLQSLGRREECRQIVGPARYFSASAVRLCGSMNFEPYVVDCIKVIAERYYSDSEVASCDQESIERRKIECLQQLGQSPGDSLPPHAVNSIRSAIRAIDSGYPYDARRILSRLLGYE